MTQKSVIEREVETPAYQTYGRIAIVMPVYNEADTIANTVEELYIKVVSQMGNVDMWLFEDGSIDGTKQMLEKLEHDFPNLYAVIDDGRKGYPGAMRDAFLNIDSHVYEYVVSLDSDGQYDPDDFFRLWEVMQKESPDIVMGRRLNRAEPLYRRILSWGLRFLEGRMFPLQCKDVTSVMRLMKSKLAQDIALEIKHSKYNFWLEFTARMSLRGCRIVELPISYRERAGGSRVYSLGKMPKVILSELSALRAVKREWKANMRLEKGKPLGQLTPQSQV